MFEFDDDTPQALRNQILAYHLTEVFTDVERARFFGLPEGCRMRERAKILARDKLSLGRNVWIGEGAMLDAQGGLAIGDYTQIGANVLIWSHTSHKQAMASKTGIGHEDIVYKRTTIGANCFIVGPSVIGPGVTIGDRVIVSPLSFVDRDLADDAVFSPSSEMRNLQTRVDKLERQLEMLLAGESRALSGTDGIVDAR